jgi:hypothetical protein
MKEGKPVNAVKVEKPLDFRGFVLEINLMNINEYGRLFTYGKLLIKYQKIYPK